MNEYAIGALAALSGTTNPRGIVRMLNARNIRPTEYGLQFDFENICQDGTLSLDGGTWQRCNIELNGSDLFDLTIAEAGRIIVEEKDIFCEDLQGVFEAATGMLTSLGEVRYS